MISLGILMVLFLLSGFKNAKEKNLSMTLKRNWGAQNIFRKATEIYRRGGEVSVARYCKAEIVIFEHAYTCSTSHDDSGDTMIAIRVYPNRSAARAVVSNRENDDYFAKGDTVLTAKLIPPIPDHYTPRNQ